MRIIAYIFTAVGALFVALFLSKRDSKGGALPTCLKSIASLLFIATGIFALLSNLHEQTTLSAKELLPPLFIIFGLVFGLVGDIVLDLKIAYPKDDLVYTYTGMASFGMGHVLYIFAVTLLFPFASVWNVGYSVAIGFVLAIIIIIGSITALNTGFGKCLVPSFLYSVLLATFMVHCLFTMIFSVAGVCTATILLFVGSVMFLISDAILSMTYFQGKSSKAIIVANHVTYYAAQFLIALSLAFIPLTAAV